MIKFKVFTLIQYHMQKIFYISLLFLGVKKKLFEQKVISANVVYRVSKSVVEDEKKNLEHFLH